MLQVGGLPQGSRLVSFLNLGILTMTGRRPLLALNILFPKQVAGFPSRLLFLSTLRSTAFGKLSGRVQAQKKQRRSVSCLSMSSRCDDHAKDDTQGKNVAFENLFVFLFIFFCFLNLSLYHLITSCQGQMIIMMETLIKSQSLEDTQVGYILQK